MACPAITLGGIVLSPHLIWEDEGKFSPVAQTVNRTLGGGIVIFSGGLLGGRPITIKSLPDQGWMTKAQVDSVQLIANVPGNIVSLAIGAQVFSVMFRHHEPQAFTASPLIFRVDAPAEDYFLVEIKLIEVA